jgi:hypothetical protein
VLAKDDYRTPICDVRVGEALGLSSALDWVHNLNLGPVDFELDSKLVLDSFNSNKVDVTEFGKIIPHRKRLFSSFYPNSNIKFVMRQVNKIAHNLTKTATCVASSKILIEIPSYIEHLLINKMVQVYFLRTKKLLYKLFRHEMKLLIQWVGKYHSV